MSLIVRFLLLSLAAVVALLVALLSQSISHALGPTESSSLLKYLHLGVIVSTPLWLPGVIPNKFATLHKIIRRISLALLCFPLLMALRNTVAAWPNFSGVTGDLDLIVGPMLLVLVLACASIFLYAEIHAKSNT